jgi:tetratricopeptide (TPR) repeat protein
MVTKTTSKAIKPAATSAGKAVVAIDPKYTQAVQMYETGIKAMQERKYDRAKVSSQKVIEANIRELGDRSRIHISACDQQSAKAALEFKTSEEHYDYAVSLMNSGDYVSSREHLEKLHKTAANKDHVLYGLATLDCLTGHLEDALRRLHEAIAANAQLRFQARNDSDFQNLAEDPRFTELLYPDPGAEAVLAGHEADVEEGQ